MPIAEMQTDLSSKGQVAYLLVAAGRSASTRARHPHVRARVCHDGRPGAPRAADARAGVPGVLVLRARRRPPVAVIAVGQREERSSSSSSRRRSRRRKPEGQPQVWRQHRHDRRKRKNAPPPARARTCRSARRGLLLPVQAEMRSVPPVRLPAAACSATRWARAVPCVTSRYPMSPVGTLCHQ